MSTRAVFGLMALLVVCQTGCNQQAHTNNDPPLQTADAVETSKSAEPFRAKFETNKGVFVIEVTPSWSPHGAARFRELVESGFYNDCRIFRVLPGFMAQFGMNGDPAVHAQWENKQIPDDPVMQSNRPGFVTFAKAGANSRTTQIFINYDEKNSRLDRDGFSPFGIVVEGMDVVESFYSGYGDEASGQQPRIAAEGNEFLDKYFPDLDSIISATLVADTSDSDQ